MIRPRIEHALNEFHYRPTKWQLFRRSGAQNGDSTAILQARAAGADAIIEIEEKRSLTDPDNPRDHAHSLAAPLCTPFQCRRSPVCCCLHWVQFAPG